MISGLVSIRRIRTGETWAPISREQGEKYIARNEGYDLVPAKACQVCGTSTSAMTDHRRCEKHQGRNPCIIEGCKRTAAAPDSGQLSCDDVICGEHWRRYVPPRSRMRKLYHSHFRRGKREGWTMRRNRQFQRFWNFLVATVRKRHEGGYLDETEINRLMGWE